MRQRRDGEPPYRYLLIDSPVKHVIAAAKRSLALTPPRPHPRRRRACIPVALIAIAVSALTSAGPPWPPRACNPRRAIVAEEVRMTDRVNEEMPVGFRVTVGAQRREHYAGEYLHHQRMRLNFSFTTEGECATGLRHITWYIGIHMKQHATCNFVSTFRDRAAKKGMRHGGLMDAGIESAMMKYDAMEPRHPIDAVFGERVRRGPMICIGEYMGQVNCTTVITNAAKVTMTTKGEREQPPTRRSPRRQEQSSFGD